MKDIVYAVLTLLQTNAALTAVVPSVNILRGNLPQNPVFSPSSPFVVITRVTKVRDQMNNTGKYATARIQCTTFATTDYQAELISDMIADTLVGISNTFINSVYVAWIDGAGATPDNSDGLTLGVFRDNHDFMIYYSFR